MTPQQKNQFDNYLRNSASQQDMINLRYHLDLEGGDNNLYSAHKVRNWVAGILAVPVLGLSLMAIKRIVRNHI